MNEKIIAERKLFFSEKNDSLKMEFFVRMYAPHHIEEGMVDFTVGPNGCSRCNVEIVGLGEDVHEEFYGADSIQALQLASNGIESILLRLQRKYCIYHLNEESYF